MDSHPSVGNPPITWIRNWANAKPDRVALVSRTGTTTYAQLLERVEDRAMVIARDMPVDRLVPVSVALDEPTVIELLAVVAASGVAMPYLDQVPMVTGTPGPDDVFAVPTSGSRGRARVVRITAGNITAAVQGSRSFLGTDGHDRWLLCLPLNHIGGLSVLWRSFEAGGSVAITPFDDDLPRFITTWNPTIASMVPTMVRRVLATDPGCLATLRFILVGGAAVDPALLDEARERGVTLLASYGMTETTSQIATVRPDGSTGDALLLEGFTVTILDPGTSSSPTPLHGVIAVEGAPVSPGYLGEPDRVGPLVTNDLGWLGDEGALHVVGRIDDVVISGGENIPLETVSEAIRSISGVRDAVAVGVPDPDWGTKVVAVVATRLHAGDLIEAMAALLAAPRRPKRWVVVDRLPLLPNGKHDIAAIQALADDAGS